MDIGCHLGVSSDGERLAVIDGGDRQGAGVAGRGCKI